MNGNRRIPCWSTCRKGNTENARNVCNGDNVVLFYVVFTPSPTSHHGSVWALPVISPANICKVCTCYQISETETTFHYCWRANSSFKLVGMESTSPCRSLIGYTLKWHGCWLVWPKSILSKTGFDRLGRDQSSFSLSAQRDEGPLKRREVVI